MAAVFLSEPLAQHGVLRTTDVSHAQDVVSRVYVEHRLDTAGGVDIDARLNAVESKVMTFGYLTYGVESRITLPPLTTCYHVNLTLNGHSAVDRGHGEHATTVARRSGTVLLPDRSATVRWSADARQFALKFPRQSLERHLSLLLNEDVKHPIPFDVSLDLTTPAGVSLLNAAEFVQREWDQDGALARFPAARRQLESLIMTSLLLAGAGGHLRSLVRVEEPPRPSVLETVVDYVQEHLEELPTLGDLAAVGGVSARALQMVFRQHLGVSPMTYVRDLRLRRVHEELRVQGPPEPSVTDAAMRWGFYNLGRFAKLYEQRYGERPSQTLRRPRG
ncbi:AraC family transcriptional regulator [Streptosporangium sp. NPDC004631]